MLDRVLVVRSCLQNFYQCRSKMAKEYVLGSLFPSILNLGLACWGKKMMKNIAFGFRSNDFEAMKAEKLAIWPWLSCRYTKNMSRVVSTKFKLSKPKYALRLFSILLIYNLHDFGPFDQKRGLNRFKSFSARAAN